MALQRHLSGDPGSSRRHATLRPAPGFTHVADLDEGVALLGEEEWRVVSDGPAARILKRLVESRTEGEVVEDLRGRMDPALIHYGILLLRHRGWLAEAARDAGGGAATPRARSRPFPDSAAPIRELDSGVVSIPGSEIWSAESWGEREGAPSVVILTDYLHPILWRRDGPVEGAAGPVLLVRAAPRGFWVGPLVDGGGEFLCVSCLARRLRANLPHLWVRHRFGRAVGGADEASRPRRRRHRVVEYLRAIPATRPAEICDRFHRSIEEVHGDGATGSELARRHRIRPWPTCPKCGEARQGSPDPEDLISPITGVVRSVDRVAVRGIRDAHVYTASHAVHLGAPTPSTLLGQRRDPSGGKGFTEGEARRSALYEALERSSALFRGSEPGGRHPFVHPYSRVAERALDPQALLNFSEEQYAHRREHNARAGGMFNRVPSPLDPEVSIGWTEVRLVGEEGLRLVPTAYVYLGYDGPGSRYFPGDSNGLAAGTTLEDSLFRGFLELVERDAVACWWYNRTRHPAVHVSAFDDPILNRIVEDYERIGRDLWALDVTSDLGIPCFAAVSRSRNGTQEDLIFGFGAHLDPGKALRSAVSELNQMLPSVQRSPEARRAQLLPEFEEALEWWETGRIDEHPYLAPSPGQDCVGPRDFEPRFADDPASDLATCVRLARLRSIEIYFVDHTRQDIGIPVAKVIAPGLRSFWRRLGPGRLYDVPVQLGRLRTPRTESEMNPISLFV